MQQKGTESMSVVPYRTAGELANTRPKDTFGLIRAPKPAPPKKPAKPVKPHVCQTPTQWTHLISFLMGRAIHPGSLFRCEHCKSLFKWYKPHYENTFKWRSVPHYEIRKEWLALGGDIAVKEND